MTAMASKITSLTIVYSTVYSGADQRKHQSIASLAFVCEGNSPVTGEFPAQRASSAENVSIYQWNILKAEWAIIALVVTPVNPTGRPRVRSGYSGGWWPIRKWAQYMCAEMYGYSGILSLNTLTRYMLFFQKKYKRIYTIYIIPARWHERGNWDPSSCRTRTCLCYTFNIMGADVLATQGARVSASMILTMLNRNNLVPAR